MKKAKKSEGGLKVGDTIWWFDQHRCRYGEDGWPNWREHWVRVKITGETTRSWVTEHCGKAPKSGKRYGWAYSQTELDALCDLQVLSQWLSRNLPSLAWEMGPGKVQARGADPLEMLARANELRAMCEEFGICI